MDTLTNIGQNIRSLRKSKHLSQEELAELSGLHRTFIGAVERGERNISINTLSKIAFALDTSLKELLIQNSHETS
jgi:transcriptional regulator with XRE-family HTH domain